MRTPVVTKILLIINILLFIPSGLGFADLSDMLGLHFFLAPDFKPYQLVTYMFMHGGFLHIFFNMFTLWIFGRVLEQVWGPKKFLLFYLVCGVGAGLCQEAVQYIEYMSDEGLVNGAITVGASGAVYAILLAFGMLFPNEKLYLYFFLPIKAKYLVIGFIVIEIITGIANNDNVAHFAHLGGMLFALIFVLYWRRQAKKRQYGFTSWEEYDGGKSMWEKLREKATSVAPKQEPIDAKWEPVEPKEESKAKDPFAERRAQQAEIDRVLDKVRKSGYSCLTEEEKKTIFEFRNK